MELLTSDTIDPLEALQERIGYRFRNIEHLKLALIHKSYANEKQLDQHCGHRCNDRHGDQSDETCAAFIIIASAAAENGCPARHVGQKHDSAGKRCGNGSDKNIAVFDMGQLMQTIERSLN